METQSSENDNIQVYVNARNLELREHKHNDFRVKFYLPKEENNMKASQYEFIAQTEIVKNNHNPIFTVPLEIAYSFEKTQPIEFRLFNISEDGSIEEEAGSTSAFLGKLVGSRSQICSLDIKFKNLPAGKLVTKVTKCTKQVHKLMWQWGGLNLVKSSGLFCCSAQKHTPFLKFYAREVGTTWSLIYKTECHKINPTPIFECFDIQLKGSNFFDLEIKIDWCDEATPEEIQGSTNLTLKDILDQKKKEFPLYQPNKISNSVTPHKLILIQSTLFQESSFLEFIFGGVQIQLITGLDFTTENLKNDRDLHSVSYDGSLNIYQQIIKLFCLILLNYEVNQMVPIFGFGAKIKSEETGQVNHCFPLGGEPSSPGSRGVGGILHMYNKTVRMLEYARPRLIIPVLEKFKELTEDNQLADIYSVCLLLIADDPDDFEASLEVLASTALLEISVFIIGVGTGSYEKMKTLSSRLDQIRKNKKTLKNLRNNVKFTSLYDNGPNIDELVKIYLKKLEKHVVEYMSLNSIVPGSPKDVDIMNFRI